MERGHIAVLVGGEPYRHCRFLAIHIPTEAAREYDVIDSIDEAMELAAKASGGYQSLEQRSLREEARLSDKERFWGHYSNLSAWAEHDYDLRLIHSNLGIGLAKRLVEAGERRALPALKRGIMENLRKGRLATLLMHIDKGTFDMLNEEERETALLDIVHRLPEMLDNAFCGMGSSALREFLRYVWRHSEHLGDLAETRISEFAMERIQEGDIWYIKTFVRSDTINLFTEEDIDECIAVIPPESKIHLPGERNETQALLKRLQKLKNMRWLMEKEKRKIEQLKREHPNGRLKYSTGY